MQSEVMIGIDSPLGHVELVSAPRFTHPIISNVTVDVHGPVSTQIPQSFQIHTMVTQQFFCGRGACITKGAHMCNTLIVGPSHSSNPLIDDFPLVRSRVDANLPRVFCLWTWFFHLSPFLLLERWSRRQSVLLSDGLLEMCTQFTVTQSALSLTLHRMCMRDFCVIPCRSGKSTCGMVKVFQRHEPHVFSFHGCECLLRNESGGQSPEGDHMFILQCTQTAFRIIDGSPSNLNNNVHSAHFIESGSSGLLEELLQFSTMVELYEERCFILAFRT